MGKLHKILFFKSTSIFSLFLSFKLFLTHISILCKRQNCTYILSTQSCSAQICKNMTVKSVQEMCCYFSLYTSFPTVSKTDILFSYYYIITENERKCFDFLFGLQSYWLLISVFSKQQKGFVNFFENLLAIVCPFSPPHFLALGRISSGFIIIEKGHVRKIHEMCLWFLGFVKSRSDSAEF